MEIVIGYTAIAVALLIGLGALGVGIGMGLLGAPGEFLDQGRLAAACLARDQGHPTPAGQGLLEQGAQVSQLLLAGNEPRAVLHLPTRWSASQ